jgi:hypothetical protein
MIMFLLVGSVSQIFGLQQQVQAEVIVHLRLNLQQPTYTCTCPVSSYNPMVSPLLGNRSGEGLTAAIYVYGMTSLEKAWPKYHPKAGCALVMG